LPVNTPDIPAKTPLSNCGRFRISPVKISVTSSHLMESDVAFASFDVISCQNDLYMQTYPVQTGSRWINRKSLGDLGRKIGSKQVMVSRIISVPKMARQSNSYNKIPVGSTSSADSESTYSTVCSLEGLRSRPHYSSQLTDPPEGFIRVRDAFLQLDTEEGSIKPCRSFSPSRLSRYRRMQLAQRGNLCDENNSGRWCMRSRLSSCSSIADEESRQIAIGVLFR
uniref:DUF4210 domain-containing protein n=1 Tax=Brugia timori TaxID=42155 RepID=A0A0R3Q5M0_9BILA